MATNANRTAYVTPIMEKIAAATSLCCCRSSIGSSWRAQSSISTAPNTAAPTSSRPTADRVLVNHIGVHGEAHDAAYLLWVPGGMHGSYRPPRAVKSLDSWASNSCRCSCRPQRAPPAGCARRPPARCLTCSRTDARRQQHEHGEDGEG